MSSYIGDCCSWLFSLFKRQNMAEEGVDMQEMKKEGDLSDAMGQSQPLVLPSAAAAARLAKYGERVEAKPKIQPDLIMKEEKIQETKNTDIMPDLTKRTQDEPSTSSTVVAPSPFQVEEEAKAETKFEVEEKAKAETKLEVEEEAKAETELEVEEEAKAETKLEVEVYETAQPFCQIDIGSTSRTQERIIYRQPMGHGGRIPPQVMRHLMKTSTLYEESQ